ncbi:NUDIX domain-containing protein [Paenibacillus humicola]|uniref:NUDIX domain-containing protein n=1 Tax=Paenibacillus humicola TaxID=3110540 RepID=UPI00237BCAFF|nr:NUDIX domain-containing protein [Paenibacillus humicola]
MFYVNARAFIERKKENETEIVLQTRNKPGEQALELPGGRLELFEPILDGLKREVLEETGLAVIEVEDGQKRIDTAGINDDFEVECVAPFCAYQTIKGPVDSIGMYFICSAEGELLAEGDETTNLMWKPVQEIERMMKENPLQFSDVDRAGILNYLKHRFGSRLVE